MLDPSHQIDIAFSIQLFYQIFTFLLLLSGTDDLQSPIGVFSWSLCSAVMLSKTCLPGVSRHTMPKTFALFTKAGLVTTSV